MKLTPKMEKFCELVAGGTPPYRACIEAGYSEKYAKRYSHKISEKYQKKIKELEIIAQNAIKNEFNYSIAESFKKLCDIQKLALNCLDKNGNPNFNALIKAEELKGKMYGLYKADNEQKSSNYEVIINRKAVNVNKD